MSINGLEIITGIRAAGVPAFTDQTGGGTATIIVGVDLEENYQDRYDRTVVLVGPGTYNWHAPDESTFYAEELYVGAHTGEDAEEGYVTVTTAADAVREAVRLYRERTAPSRLED